MDVEDCERTLTPEIVNKKRSRISPTLDTLQRNVRRTPLREKAQNATVHVAPRQRRLQLHKLSPVDQAIQNSREKWSDTEIGALVEFVIWYSAGDSWPTHKQDSFWSSAILSYYHHIIILSSYYHIIIIISYMMLLANTEQQCLNKFGISFCGWVY